MSFYYKIKYRYCCKADSKTNALSYPSQPHEHWSAKYVIIVINVSLRVRYSAAAM